MIINNKELLNTLGDIENYIDKTYKLSPEEYALVLNMLRERLNKKKFESKTKGIVGKVREMMA